jgi:hypothetical protein
MNPLWRTSGLKNDKGVLVACDQELEWILPWWWNHYRAHNSHEIAFVDFGLSKEAQDWCRQRGELVPLNISFEIAVPREAIPTERVALWEKIYNPSRLWESRRRWFKTPLAMLQSPFQSTIWIDLDCEIKGSITPLFDYCPSKENLALVPEIQPSIDKQVALGILKSGDKFYNTGVIVYPYDSLMIKKWAEGCLTQTAEFPGNQNLLASLIKKEKFTVTELPSIYNWRMSMGPNSEAIIIHWVSKGGKFHIWKSIQEEKLRNNEG